MPDAYAVVRSLPLLAVLSSLGFTEWKPRKEGTEWSGACPVCKPKKNRGNFSFAADGKFRCFSCPVKGRGAIDVVQAVRQCGFQEAVSLLTQLRGPFGTRLPVQPQQPPEQTAQVPTENPPFRSTYEKYAVPSAWLAARGLTEDTLKRYEVFQYENPARRSVYSGSVMLKIRRWSDGECVGYMSRNIGEVTQERPKYSLPKGLQKGLELWGAIQLKEKAPHRVVYLLESPLAVMKFSQHELPAVSCFGWSVSEQQAAILAHLAKGIIFLPDSNVYEQAVASVAHLTKHLWLKSPPLPAHVSDPEQLSVSEIQALT